VNGTTRSVSTEQSSTDFVFEASRDDEPSKTDYVKGGAAGDDPLLGNPQDLKGELSNELLEYMRASVLVDGNTTGDDPKAAAITLADFKMLVVLGKGTFGKVFLGELNKNKKLYAIKVIRKDILIEYN